ncbi:rhodanese-like domain-containing protein [Nesterenkonia sandarakina]|uniref:Rhodanese-related sulfurtransferase n=1 Tax=Nesterenkonia sandarakina TaxID=272918 RepID=A0A2T0YAY9_9MICC|nr:rhodanese-like domain-containing protein [Nesterenkonia sandarakina]PRZ11880.1 rhodanese-related sulfurtransferase [Nesterenkonia sandarakina]
MQEISPAATVNRLDTVQIVDVREDDEVAVGVIPGAVHIPLGQLSALLAELDSAREIITVCRSGKRSLHAAQVLAGEGFSVASMRGGMNQWSAENHPISAL